MSIAAFVKLSVVCVITRLAFSLGGISAAAEKVLFSVAVVTYCFALSSPPKEIISH